MDYLSTKETAALLNVSERTVSRAAKNGKIQNAILKGNNWLIPKNADKPVDFRTKRSRIPSENTSVKDDYKFPFFIFNEYYANYNLLSKLEKMLLNTQILVFQCRFKEANDKVQLLLSKTTPYSPDYMRIGTLHTAIYLSVYLDDPSPIKEYVKEYDEIFSKDFPHKNDLMLCYISIHSSILGSNIIQTSKFELEYPYSPSAITYLYILNSRRAMFKSISDTHPTDFSMFEIVKNRMLQYGIPIAAQSINCHLAVRNQIIGNIGKAKEHLLIALNIAKNTGCYELIGETSQILEKELIDFIKSYDEKLYKNIENNLKTVTKGLIKVARLLFGNQSFSDFTDKDYELIPYVLKGLTNKEIASSLDISTDAVSKRISQLLFKTCTSDRKELRAYLLTKMQTKAIL